MLEAIAMCEEIAGAELSWTLDDRARMGDHRWWISDLSDFEADYPDWSIEFDVRAILEQIYEQNLERWAVRA
jgi:CDP-paratose 2-epimerase